MKKLLFGFMVLTSISAFASGNPNTYDFEDVIKFDLESYPHYCKNVKRCEARPVVDIDLTIYRKNLIVVRYSVNNANDFSEIAFGSEDFDTSYSNMNLIISLRKYLILKGSIASTDKLQVLSIEQYQDTSLDSPQRYIGHGVTIYYENEEYHSSLTGGKNLIQAWEAGAY